MTPASVSSCSSSLFYCRLKDEAVCRRTCHSTKKFALAIRYRGALGFTQIPCKFSPKFDVNRPGHWQRRQVTSICIVSLWFKFCSILRQSDNKVTFSEPCARPFSWWRTVWVLSFRKFQVIRWTPRDATFRGEWGWVSSQRRRRAQDFQVVSFTVLVACNTIGANFNFGGFRKWVIFQI